VSFRLAHFSDVHLGPLPFGAAFRHFATKRLIGAVSWHARRKWNQRPDIAIALRDAVLAEAPDHVVCSGDIVNIAAREEFAPARDFLAGFGAFEQLTFAPGNHDTYVDVPYNKGLSHFEPWMASDLKTPQADPAWPRIRLRRNVALVSLNSAQPQKYNLAQGTLGPQQLDATAKALAVLRERGFCRIVNIHHPPLPGFAPDRKALTDAEELKSVLADVGAELVLHGHNHKTMMHALKTRSGPLAVIGVPSASSSGAGHHEAAAFHMFSINRQNREWQIAMTPHRWHEGRFIKGADFVLPSGAPVRQNQSA
jgi:3',5'-cyclic AMP phosphodiesterase CpdA